MISYIITFFILLLNFILQSTILQHFKVLGVIPNTALIIVVIFALLRGRYYGGFTGLFAGLLQDIFFSGAIGINAFIYFIVGYASGLLDDKVFKENLVLPPLTIIGATTIYYIMYYLFMLFLSRDVSFITVVKDILLKEMIYNVILVMFLYKKVLKYYKEPTIKFTKK